MKATFILFLVTVLMNSPTGVQAKPVNLDFDGRMSREVLEGYLSRAVTHAGLCASSPEQATSCLKDDVRMLTIINAKFVGRAAYTWDQPADEEAFFRQAADSAAVVHKADSRIILQAGIFEAVYEGVNNVPVPDWVFAEFGLAPESRNFRYEAMLYDGGDLRDHWMKGASVPDMSKLETRMWFYYRARRYIDSGFEAIHFGQIHLMDKADPTHQYWSDMLGRVRHYAAGKARRHFVLCDAHTHGVVSNGVLLFDFHSWPLRPVEIYSRPQHCQLTYENTDTIIGHSQGGRTPSGWTCEFLPYLLEFDNYGSSGQAGIPGKKPFVWGYDEICWFARQPQDYRNAFLRYAWDWLRKEDPNGWLQMPTRRNLADPVNNGGTIDMYQANTHSAACPHGFGQEETILSIWSRDQSRSQR